jgi:hypothetical protein
LATCIMTYAKPRQLDVEMLFERCLGAFHQHSAPPTEPPANGTVPCQPRSAAISSMVACRGSISEV